MAKQSSSRTAKAMRQEEIDARFRRYVEDTAGIPINHETVVRQFLAEGADPNQYIVMDNGIRAPIISKFANVGPGYSMLRDALAAGADPALYDDEGQTFLHRLPGSPRSGDWAERVHEIFQYFPTLDIPSRAPVRRSADAWPGMRPETGLTPLHMAAKGSHTRFTRTLLRHGAQADYPSSRGNTPLMMALASAHIPVIAMLGYYGANPDARNDRQQTVHDLLAAQEVLPLAVRMRRPQVERLLDDMARYPWLRHDGDFTKAQLLEKDAQGRSGLTSDLFACNFVEIMAQLHARGETITGQELQAHECIPGEESVWSNIMRHTHPGAPHREIFEALHAPGRLLTPEDIRQPDGQPTAIYYFLRNSQFLPELFDREKWRGADPEQALDLLHAIPREDRELLGNPHRLVILLNRQRDQQQSLPGRH